MSLEEQYLAAFNEFKSTLKTNIPSPKEAIALLDLTLLDEEASDEALGNLSEKASTHQVAAVCVFPKDLEKIRPIMGIKKATVVNFPEGNGATNRVLAAIDNAQADEIDYVFPHQAYMEGEKQDALAQCQQVYERCQQQGKLLKVIIETGALPSLDFINHLSTELIHSGCDFIKTSTGKIAQGATLASAFAILKAIKDSKKPCGLKVSGGIKTPEQAFSYMTLAQQILERTVDKSWFRIGTSSLLDELV